MRFLNFLPFAAAFAAALPEVKLPNKDVAVVKRDPAPCTSSESTSTETSGCPNHDDNTSKYDYTKYDVQGCLIFDLRVTGTFDLYSVSFQAFNPNTNWHTDCTSNVQNSPDYQTCERVRTLFVFNIDDNELTKASATITIKLRWIYFPGALPAAMEAAKGNYDNVNEYKDLVYYQDGEVRLQIDCSGDDGSTANENTNENTNTNTHTGNSNPNEVGSPHRKREPCPDPCFNPQPETKEVSCKFTGTITITVGVLMKGEPSDEHDSS